MRLSNGLESIGLASLLGMAALGCAGSSKPAETPTSAESDEQVAPNAASPQNDFETSMEFEGEAEKDDAARDEYVPPPTQTYSPAVKLQNRDAAGK